VRLSSAFQAILRKGRFAEFTSQFGEGKALAEEFGNNVAETVGVSQRVVFGSAIVVANICSSR